MQMQHDVQEETALCGDDQATPLNKYRGTANPSTLTVVGELSDVNSNSPDEDIGRLPFPVFRQEEVVEQELQENSPKPGDQDP